MKKILLMVLLCISVTAFGSIKYIHINDGTHQMISPYGFRAEAHANYNEEIPIVVCWAMRPDGSAISDNVRWRITLNKEQYNYGKEGGMFTTSEFRPHEKCIWDIIAIASFIFPHGEDPYLNVHCVTH